MITDQTHVDFFSGIAERLHVAMISRDYGDANVSKLPLLTSKIKRIYQYLNYASFENVKIFIGLNAAQKIQTLFPQDSIQISQEANFAGLHGTSIVIEILNNGELSYLIDRPVNADTIKDDCILYEKDSQTNCEIIHGKGDTSILPAIPGADSYFAVQTYKFLESALQDYGTSVARLSDCEILTEAWFDNNRIFFKPGPEYLMRNSLTRFLKSRLRGDAEVRPEQVVDDSHPVDIKVTWTYTAHLALIEIKWLGKSLAAYGSTFTKTFNDGRALEGAQQLAEYLDANQIQSPYKTTKGYLVVFDARRWRCNNRATSVNRANGLRYANDQIQYNPDHNAIRTDFAKPIKFFLEPRIS